MDAAGLQPTKFQQEPLGSLEDGPPEIFLVGIRGFGGKVRLCREIGLKLWIFFAKSGEPGCQSKQRLREGRGGVLHAGGRFQISAIPCDRLLTRTSKQFRPPQPEQRADQKREYKRHARYQSQWNLNQIKGAED